MTCRNDPIRSLEWSEPISVGEQMTLRAVSTVLARYEGRSHRRRDTVRGSYQNEMSWARWPGGDPDKLWINDVMTSDLVTISPGTAIIDGARRVLEAGVVSMRDVLAVLRRRRHPDRG